MQKRLFTSESVTEGHPDKICDQISDAILDELLKQDPMSRVACETVVTTGLVLVMGEITTQGYVDIQKIVRDTIREIGYDRAKYGFDADTCGVIVSINEQSQDIALGVDRSYEIKENLTDDEDLSLIGAGDQGMMYGYATDETEEYMPYAISLAHKLTYRLSQVRKQKILDYLRPDGKSQVTVEYDENGKPIHLNAVVLSTQHDEKVSMNQMGIDVNLVVMATFAMAGTLGGISGMLTGINYTLYPQLGNMVVKGFISSVIGGLGSVNGAVIAALCLGVTEIFLIKYIGSGFTPVCLFVIVIVFLIFRPRGIAGRLLQEKV